MTQRLFYLKEALNDSDAGDDEQDKFVECTQEEANLIGSLCDDGSHQPCIDVDLPARLLPSSTPGHFHLYFDVSMTWEQYTELLKAMTAAGLVSKYYLNFSLKRGMTHVRCPWVKKVKPEP